MGRGGGHTPAGPWQRGPGYGLRTVPNPATSTVLLPGALQPPTPYGRYCDVLRPTSAKAPLRRLPSEHTALAPGLNLAQTQEEEEKALAAAERLAHNTESAMERREAQQTAKKCYGRLGNVLFAKGEYAVACEKYQACLSLCKKLNDEAGLSRALGNLANATSRVNDNLAEKLFKECISAAERTKDLQTQYKALGGLQALYRKRHDFLSVSEITDCSHYRSQEQGDAHNCSD
jgi:tetratricopeptide (TPR) repeat protein